MRDITRLMQAEHGRETHKRCRSNALLLSPSQTEEETHEKELNDLLDSAIMEIHSPLKSNVSCPICQADIMENPQVMVLCGHSFCEQCLVEMKDHEPDVPTRCPTCRNGDEERPNTWVPNVTVRNIINESILYRCPCCDISDSPAESMLYTKGDLKKHLSECPCRRCCCRFTGCEAMLLPSEVEGHNEEAMQYHLEVSMKQKEVLELAVDALRDEARNTCAEVEALKNMVEGMKAHTWVNNGFMGGITEEECSTMNVAGYGANDMTTIHVPRDRPTIESALELSCTRGGAVIMLAPGVYKETLRVTEGRTIVMGTLDENGESLSMIEKSAKPWIVHCSGEGTSLTLVDLKIRHHHNHHVESHLQHESCPVNAAISSAPGSDVRVVRCDCQSSAGHVIAAFEVGDYAGHDDLSLVPVRLRLEHCRIGHSQMDGGDGVFLSGRFKATIDNCVFMNNLNAIEAHVDQDARNSSTIYVTDTQIHGVKETAVSLKYTKCCGHRVQSDRQRRDESYCIITLNNVKSNGVGLGPDEIPEGQVGHKRLLHVCSELQQETEHDEADIVEEFYPSHPHISSPEHSRRLGVYSPLHDKHTHHRADVLIARRVALLKQ